MLIFASVVYDVKDTKFEWNSQPNYWEGIKGTVVYDVKDTKFEWNSQLELNISNYRFSCL